MFLQLNSFHILAIYASEPNHEKNDRELAKNGVEGLLRWSILVMAERSHREWQRTY